MSGRVVASGVIIVIAIMVLAPAPGLLSTDLLFDHFDGSSLDASRWAIREQNGDISVSGGRLVMTNGFHKRVDSVQAFSLASAEARVRLGSPGGQADYMKFGFEVNAITESPGLPGFYFDTLEPSFGGEVGHIVALAYDASHNLLLEQRVALNCEAFHVLRIDWTNASVDFYVDGTLMGTAAYSFSGALTLGLWNDRGYRMETDWVRVFQGGEILRARAGGPYAGLEGSPVTFDASLSADPEGDPLTFRWDFESDGVWDTTAVSDPTAAHSYSDDFQGLATVEVSDGAAAFEI